MLKEIIKFHGRQCGKTHKLMIDTFLPSKTIKLIVSSWEIRVHLIKNYDLTDEQAERITIKGMLGVDNEGN